MPKFEIPEVLNHPLLKPRFFWPLPTLLREILVFIAAAVRFALQEYELPVTHLVLINMTSREEFFDDLRETVKRLLP
jgi:hypothetical protein